MNKKRLAHMLKQALLQLMEYSGNEYYGDYSVVETILLLESQYGEDADLRRQFVDTYGDTPEERIADDNSLTTNTR